MNVVDSFTVEIGLDRTKFQQGQAESAADMNRMKSQMGQDAGEIERQIGNKFEEAMGKVTRQIAVLFGLLLGARGIKDFIENTTRAEVGLGIVSNALGIAPQRVSAFENAIQAAGGTAEDAVQSLSNFNNIMQGMRNEGRAPPQWFSAIGGGAIDMGSGDSLSRLVQVADLIQKFHADDTTKMWALGQMGFTSLAVQKFLMQGGDKVRKELNRQSGSAMTKSQVASGDRLMSAFYDVRNSIASFGRNVLEKLEPSLTPLLEEFRKWVDANGQLVSTWIGDKVAKLKTFIDGGGLNTVRDWIVSVAEKIKSIVDKIGGWQKASELVFAAWGVYKLAPMAAGLALVIASLIGAGSGLWPVVIALGAVLAAYTTFMGSPNGASAATAPSAQVSPQTTSAGASSSPSASATDDVSENKPLPVKMMSLPIQDDSIGGLALRLVGKVGERLKIAMANFAQGGGLPGGGQSNPGGSFGDAAGKGPVQDFIRSAFKARGVDPAYALRVAGGEGGFNPNWVGGGDDQSSFGPFQLHYGGISQKFPHAGMGDEFTRETGLSAKTNATWRQQVEFVANWVAVHGWGAWGGSSSHSFITGKMGVGANAHPMPLGTTTLPLSGAGPSASNAASDANRAASAINKHITLPGLHVQTNSAQPANIARDIRVALQRELTANLAMG